MKIKDMLREKKPTISFEIFPPKTDYSLANIYKTIGELKDLNPDFISVTYGAGGTTKDTTVEIASKIKNEFDIETIAHLTCVRSNEKDVSASIGGGIIMASVGGGIGMAFLIRCRSARKESAKYSCRL